MKRLPILKWMLIMLLFLVLLVIGILGISPIAYLFRHSIIKNPKKFWNHLGLSWFTDDSETWGNTEQNYLNNWYGVYEIFNYDYDGFKKFNIFVKAYWNYRWMAWRNPHWKAKRALAPISGDKHSISFKINTITPERPITDVLPLNIEWLSLTERGVFFGYYWIEDQKFFRYAHNLEFWFFGKIVHSFELGTRHVDQKRYAAKSKFNKI